MIIDMEEGRTKMIELIKIILTAVGALYVGFCIGSTTTELIIMALGK